MRVTIQIKPNQLLRSHMNHEDQTSNTSQIKHVTQIMLRTYLVS